MSNDGKIEEKRLALVIEALDQALANTGKSMNSKAKAKAIAKMYAIARDDVPAAEMLDLLRKALGEKEAGRPQPARKK